MTTNEKGPDGANVKGLRCSKQRNQLQVKSYHNSTTTQKRPLDDLRSCAEKLRVRLTRQLRCPCCASMFTVDDFDGLYAITNAGTILGLRFQLCRDCRSAMSRYRKAVSNLQMEVAAGYLYRSRSMEVAP